MAVPSFPTHLFQVQPEVTDIRLPPSTDVRATASTLMHYGLSYLERAPSLEAVELEWKELAEGSANPFTSWEWARVWWRHFGRGRQPLVLVCRASDRRAVGLLPLYLGFSHPLRVARLIGDGPADQLGPLCRPEQRNAVAAALLHALAEYRCHIFFGQTLPGDESWSDLLSAEVYARDPNPILPLVWSSWEEFLESRSGNFREQVRRRERTLQKLGLRYRLCERRDRLDEDLDVLFALHRRRWRAGGSNFGRLELFHREFTKCAFERGWLRLWFLEVDAAPVAAWYGLRLHGVDWYYQAGRDPAWDRYSVGFLLLAHSVREAIADGMLEYRFGRGGQHYKARFGPDDQGLETVLLSRGRLGALAVAGVGVARRGKRALKALPEPRRLLLPGR
jgi:CelD/BcsL family acetyltransferase involved in cellulose biosynthesis